MCSRAVQCTRRVVVFGVLIVFALTGCAGSGARPLPSPAPVTGSVVVPAGGVSLSQLGFRHGPAGFVTVPSGVRLTQRVDQPNVVTVGFAAPAGAEIARWLETELPAAGFTVTSGGDEAVLFDGHGWSGAFTVGGGESALTLRRNRD